MNGEFRDESIQLSSADSYQVSVAVKEERDQLLIASSHVNPILDEIPQ